MRLKQIGIDLHSSESGVTGPLPGLIRRWAAVMIDYLEINEVKAEKGFCELRGSVFLYWLRQSKCLSAASQQDLVSQRSPNILACDCPNDVNSI